MLRMPPCFALSGPLKRGHIIYDLFEMELTACAQWFVDQWLCVDEVQLQLAALKTIFSLISGTSRIYVIV